MKILTSKQMKEIDKQAIENLGIIGPILMENAGLKVFNEIRTRFPRLQEERIIIVAGKGNNGGDGLVVARHLFNQGCQPQVFLLANKEEVKGDAALNLGIAQRIGVQISEISSLGEWENYRNELFQADILVDAIFGTGLIKPAAGIYAKVIEDINKAKAFKVAVDIPSGLSSDTFQIIGPCVKAQLTVTLGAPKIAHIFPPAEEYVGQLIVADISLPSFLLESDELRLELVEKGNLLPYFKQRKKDTHKGTYGHLFILSGSMGKTGAAAMAGKAALKMGAGLVTVGTPESCLPIIARSMVELMTEPLPETERKTLAFEGLERILDLLEGKDALLIGPGISTHPSTADLVLSLLPKIKIPAVVDADALNILASNPDLLKSLKVPVVLTPHPGEFARLLHLSTREVVANKLELAPQFAQKYGVYLVLKGYRTIVADPEGFVFVNPTGNPGLATAGAGDVLGGMMAAMIIQEKKLLEAILGAVYVHGLSGDIGAEKLGERALTAGNLITYLPSALKRMRYL